MPLSLSRVLALIAPALLAGPLQAQIFVRDSTNVPDQAVGPQRFTENIDFADVDLDGDFDAAHARGGDLGNIQDRLWINRGGLQTGPVGRFSDQTLTRMPQFARDGRDIEFVDFDNDGDFDMYSSNTSTNSNQGNLFLENDGGKQGGSLGFYTTKNKFVGLGGPGSSVDPALLVQGSFIDWSCDCDFGDLDNDGDMDLVHSSYGGNFGGQVPTRIFLNDGDGFFAEFNPSGFQISGTTIAGGDPGLWCEGTQQANTSNTSGVHCDIATNTLDIDVGDVDGDFDLDILHGDRSSFTRFFHNRLEENGGTLSFRDVTNLVYPANWSDGEGHYEQEMGDFDGDNDLDLYGLNWRAGGFGFDDNVFENVNGQFTNQTILPGSDADDNEGDWGDFDNDGDLDLYVANFSGLDKLYENDGTGGLSLIPGGSSGSGLDSPGFSGYSALDADWCDIDLDGDYDVFAAQDTNRPVVYWQNQTDVPDTTAPRVSPVEQIAGAAATITTSPDRVVRAHVYDNAPYYVTWYNPTSLSIYLDGELVTTRTAVSSGGQVFRAEIPSNLVGTVAYEFVSEDRYSNSATSAQRSYVASDGGRTVDVDYGAAENGPDFAGELLLGGGSLLTPGKPWFLRVDVNTGLPSAVYLLAISLAPSAATPDPLLGMLNVDATQVVLGLLGTVGATGVDWIELEVDPTATGISSVFAQAFRPNPSGGWSASRGLEIPFHE